MSRPAPAKPGADCWPPPADCCSYGDDDGSFGALDAKTGKRVWRFPLNARWHASPMTYAIDGRQYVAVAMNASIIAFALPQ